MLVCNSLVDLFFTTTSLVIELRMYSIGDIVVYSVTSMSWTSLHIKFMASVVFWFSLHLTVFVATVPFVIRYFAVCKNQQLRRWKFALVYGVEVLIAFAASATLYFAWWPEVEKMNLRFPPDSMPCVDPGAIPSFLSSETANPRVASVLGMYIVLILIHYIVIVFCGTSISRRVKQSSQESRAIDSQHRQITRVIVFQVCLQGVSYPLKSLHKHQYGQNALTPFVVAVLPVLAGVSGMLYSVRRLDVLNELGPTLVAWIPVLNPIFAICFVRSYRRSFLAALRLGNGTVASEQNTPNNSPPGRS